MGVVYLAEQVRLRRYVALKVIAPELAEDEDFRRRFERESQLAASLDHPNVIPVFEAGESDGTLYISMRFVEGDDLRRLIRSEGHLASTRATRLVAQLASALDAAHAKGLVHRDVKPANVLVSGPVGSEHAYLTDFGLTKHVSSTSGITHTGQWVGTLDYVAPEQISGGPLDARVDVYSLGCVLFEALTGRVPYPKDSDVAKMYAHLNEPPEPVSQLVPGVPVEMDRVLERALAKAPEDRYPSAGDLGRAAVAACAGQSNTVPERSVAVGEASPTGVEARRSASTQAYRPATTARLPHHAAAGTAQLPASAWGPPAAAPRAAGHARMRWVILAICATVLALAGMAAALIAGGALDGDGGKATTVLVRDPPQADAPRANDARGRDDTTTDRPPDSGASGETLAYSSGTYSADYPADWALVEDDIDKGAYTQTKFVSPGGSATVVIDRTPGAPLDPIDEALEVEQGTAATPGYRRITLERTTIGGRPAAKWVFDLPEGRRVDYFVDFEGGRYAVLGHGPDFATASRVAREVAESLR